MSESMEGMVPIFRMKEGDNLNTSSSSSTAQGDSGGMQEKSQSVQQQEGRNSMCGFDDHLIFREIKINGAESNITVLRRKKSEAEAWQKDNAMLSYQQTEGSYPDKNDADQTTDKAGIFFIVAWEKHQTYAHWFAWEYLVGLLRSSTLLAQPPAEFEGTPLGTSASNMSEGSTMKLVEAIIPLLFLDRDIEDSRNHFLAHSTPNKPINNKKRMGGNAGEGDGNTETVISLMDIVSSGPAKETKWGALKGGFRGNLKMKYYDALKKDSKDLVALRELGYLFSLDGDVELSSQLLFRCASEMTSPNDAQHSKVWLTLARSLLGCCWTQSSTEKDSFQLNECNLAYQQALRFIDNVSSPQVWYESAIANMMVGDIEGAAQRCSLLLTEFPAFEHVVSVIHTAGILLMYLAKSALKGNDDKTKPDAGKLEVAITYLSHISSSPLEPYTQYHYDFFIARIKDIIQSDGDTISLSLKQDLYKDVFERLKNDNEIMQALEENNDPWCLAEAGDVVSWLENEMLWWNIGAFCATQSHFILAVEFFGMAVATSNHQNPDFLCWLADAYLGCGPSFYGKAKLFATQALELDPESDFARNVYEFVNNPPQSLFEDRTKIPLRELLLPYQEEEEQAASLMQGLFRLKKAKENVEVKKKVEKRKKDGATKIQGVFRGKKGREKAKGVKSRIHVNVEQQIEEGKKKEAAVSLQKLARSKKAKKKVTKKRKEIEENNIIMLRNAELLQQEQELLKQKQEALKQEQEALKHEQERSALKVQTILRGKTGREKAKRQKQSKDDSSNAASLIQKHIRGKKARSDVATKMMHIKEDSNAACKIQSLFRAKKGRKKFRRKKARTENARLRFQKEAEETHQDTVRFPTSKELSNNSLLQHQIPGLKIKTDLFLDVENSPFEIQKRKSLKKFKRYGFSSTVTTSAYIRHWESLLTALLCIFPEPKIIRRRTAEVMSLSPGITEDEALCALAACYGVVGEAVGRLRSESFKHETMSICSIVDIQSYVFRTEKNDMSLGWPSNSSLLSGGGFSLSSPTSPYKRRGLTALRLSETRIMKNSTSAPELSFETEVKNKTNSDEQSKKPKSMRAQQKWCAKACCGRSSITRRRDLDSMIESCINANSEGLSNQDFDGNLSPIPFSRSCCYLFTYFILITQ
jgi:hypothetical protein